MPREDPSWKLSYKELIMKKIMFFHELIMKKIMFFHEKEMRVKAQGN